MYNCRVPLNYLINKADDVRLDQWRILVVILI